ncbi:MFS transporter OS=Streptomyces antimycoticus OX=68175 GN=SANT12839_053360 PE=4 SV=1 [Streptomyces antimycoticus]
MASGAHQVFLWGALISIVGFLAAWFVKEVPLRGGPGKAADGGDEAPADAAPVAETV